MLSFRVVATQLRRLALASVFAVPLALGLHAQPQAPATQTPTPQAPAPPDAAAQTPPAPPSFRTDINFVRVDVLVSDRQGNPVGDLRQQDFEITEDGKPQTIQTFKLINISEGGGATPGMDPARPIRNAIDEQSEAARDDVRLYAVFLDDYHVRLENSVRAGEPIARFIENRLQPADMVGIMYPLWSLNDVLLSRDRSEVAGAIRTFRGRKYDYTPRNLFEERYANQVSTMEAERIRNQVTMSAIKGLIVKLGGLREGRKAIILVSEGFTNSLPSQAQDPIAAAPGMPGPGGTGGISRPLDPVGPGQAREFSQEFFLKTDLLSDLRAIYEMANRYNTTIYTVDPRGLATNEFDLSRSNVSPAKDQAMLSGTQDTMRILAEETDGRAIVNQNDLEAGMRQIVRDSSAYYLIGYSSTLSKPDGKFHPITVRVKRPGVQVRARRGYLALTATEAERALTPPKPGPPRAISEALGTLSVPARRSLIRSWVGMSPGSAGKTKISFVWTPVPPPPGVRTEAPARVSLVAGNANSDLFFRGRSAAPAAAPGAAAGVVMPPSRVEFDVPPGPIELDIAVEDAGNQVLDRETRKIIVPSMGPGLTISTPEVFRARTVREWQALSADAAAVPLPEREFRRTERLLVRVGAQSAAGSPTLGARLLNREGGELAVLTTSPAGFGGLTHIDAPLAAIPPGDYLIEIQASDGTEQTVTLVAIRITG